MKIEEKKQAEIKRMLGAKAAMFVQDGMCVGLGTGSTATYFIESLIERVRVGLSISAVASSNASLKQAQKGGIPTSDFSQITSIDLTVDGADEVDPQKRLIKGKGGALTREKIVAAASKRTLIIVDASKMVQTLGRVGLPIEILPFGYRFTLQHLQKAGYEGTLRLQGTTPYVTDNGNYIYDIHTPQCFNNPEASHHSIIEIPGVIETGFFFNLASSILIGYPNGVIELKE